MKNKIIAILRGITPHECDAIFDLLIDAGIKTIEIPLNSPDALNSILLMVKKYGSSCNIGAGTVTNTEEVRQVKASGASFIVSPNCDEDVIKAAVANGLDCYPGVFSPTEMFNAVKWGATNLKLFPASTLGVAHFKAIKEVLPKNIKVFAVGGINDSNIAEWCDASIDGFGFGTSLYKAGDSVDAVKAKIDRLKL